MKVGDLVYCVGRGRSVIGIVVKIEEADRGPYHPYPKDALLLTGRGLEWWPECLVGIVP